MNIRDRLQGWTAPLHRSSVPARTVGVPADGFSRGANPLPRLLDRLRDLVSGGPASATYRDAAGGRQTGDPRLVLSQLLPPTLAPLVLGNVVPRLLLETERAMSRGANGPGEALSGDLTVQDSTYALSGARDVPQVSVQGPAADFKVSLAAGRKGADVVIDGTFGGQSGRMTIPAEVLQADPASTFAVGPRSEVWTCSGATAAFHRTDRATDVGTPVAGDLGRALRASRPFPSQHHKIVSEDINIRGYRTTNEKASLFPDFSIRGGAYLGIGSAQNYDHMTTARSELAFLVDVDPRVTQDHHGMLALIGASRNANHFLSMLAGVRLTPAEERMHPTALLGALRKRPQDAEYKAATLRLVQAHNPNADLTAVRQVVSDAQSFIKTWGDQCREGSANMWLTEPERFSHMQFMSNSGRIIPRTADIAGSTTMPAIGEALADWNSKHPPLQMNVVYLTNAEDWIAQNKSGANGYSGVVSNLLKLPLNPDGVILRTGDKNGFGGDAGFGVWRYQTLPMDQFRKAVDAQDAPQYLATNRAVAGAADLHAAREQERRRFAGVSD